MHLLVIEDERALCETIVRSLRRLAYSVDYCYDGEKALALLGVERYDLVLLDLNLPKKDGMTVLRTLRQTDRETRVLILSARSEVEDKVQGLDAGAVPTSANIKHYANIVAEKAMLRRLIKLNEEIANTCYVGKESLETILEDTEKRVFNLIQRRNTEDFVPIRQVVMNAMEQIEKASKNKGSVTGIATGFA